MTLRVLLSAPATDDTLFLLDVLTELDGARCWSDWVHVEASHASTWSETEGILATDAIDMLLLDPDLRECQGSETFRRAQAAAPQVAVILLIDPSGIPLAERMVRDGAQDFLLKKDVDCVPLARAMRAALDRHRLLVATRATSMSDHLTGLLTRPAFLTLADRDRLLAERFNRRMMILIGESPQQFLSTQVRDLALVELADGLRDVTGPTALVARLGDAQFGVAVFDTEGESVEEIRARFDAAAREGKINLQRSRVRSPASHLSRRSTRSGRVGSASIHVRRFRLAGHPMR